jgi:DNA-binding CsgD family transcriptional regulator
VNKLNLDAFLHRLEDVTAIDEIHGLTLGLRDHYQIDHAVYHWVSADGEQYGFGSYPPEWAQHYVDKDYLRIDPVVIGCFQGANPINWKRLDWSSKAARVFQRDAIDHGIGNQGYSIPLHGPNGQFAVFSISHTCSDDIWEAFTIEHQRDLLLIAYFLNQKALELEKNRVPEPTRPLSPREVDALTFLAMGYGRAQVAVMLSISEHTLRAYIESARFKLGATNTIHAVAKSLSEGHIVVGGAAREAAGGWPGRKTNADLSHHN